MSNYENKKFGRVTIQFLLNDKTPVIVSLESGEWDTYNIALEYESVSDDNGVSCNLTGDEVNFLYGFKDEAERWENRMKD
jgi:hypothetical protein